MTAAGTAVAGLAVALTIAGLTGGCGSATDTSHLDEPRVVAPQQTPPPVLYVGDTVTWGSS